MAPRREQAPTSISAFFLGGVIPKAAVGDILEQLYLRGLGGFQMDPVYDKPEPARVARQKIQALPPPNGSAPLPLAAPSADAKHLSVRAWLYAVLQSNPLSRPAIREMAKLAGYPVNQVTARLGQMVKDREIKQKGELYYHGKAIPPQRAGKAKRNGAHGAAPAPAPESITLPREGTGAYTVYDLLRRAHPDPLTLSALRETFQRLKYRPNSASVHLDLLLKKGLIERPAPATYLYIPRPTTQPTKE